MSGQVIATPWRAVGAGVSASVEGWGGIVIATVTRGAEGPTASIRAGLAMSVVVVEGDIDRDTAPLIVEALSRGIDDQPRTCLDMHGVDILDAAGVRGLLTADRYAVDRGRILGLRGVHGMPQHVLAVLGLDRFAAAHN